jgi:aryl sulfotransferase
LRKILAAVTVVNKMKNIIWLASYPKSGSTWFRFFLSNLLQDSDKPADINRLEKTLIASSRILFDDITGIASADLTHDEIDNLRPDMYRFLSEEAKELCFLKIHDAYTYVDKGRPLVPPEVTHGVIYIIRNPMDVAVSFANHSGFSIDESIERLNDESFCFCDTTGKLEVQLRQRLLSWSGHVWSWIQAPGLDVHVMRYEDMKQKPEETFVQATRFAGLEHPSGKIRKALKYSDFKEMQYQEREKGFIEKSPDCGSFFYKGEVGTWRNLLNEKQVQTIINAHQKVMEQFGYLDDNNEPVF